MIYVRCLQSLARVLAISALLSATSDNIGARFWVQNRISLTSVNGALVELLRDTYRSDTIPVCWGAIVAARKEGCIVLTAAHCVVSEPQQTAPRTYVRFQDESVSQVSQIFVHPRFTMRHRSANFDIAALEVPSCEGVQIAIPMSRTRARLSTGYIITVSNKSRLKGPSTWTAVPVADATATSLTLADAAPLCTGSSGAPVLLHETDGYALAGVVSSGPSDCAGAVKVARLSAAFRGFLDNILDGRQPREAPRTCGECIEQSWEGDAPCVTSINACRNDTPCAEAFACMSAPQEEHCSHVAGIPKSSQDMLGRAQRCVCRVQCRMECSDSCCDGS